MSEQYTKATISNIEYAACHGVICCNNTQFYKHLLTWPQIQPDTLDTKTNLTTRNSETIKSFRLESFIETDIHTHTPKNIVLHLVSLVITTSS